MGPGHVRDLWGVSLTEQNLMCAKMIVNFSVNFKPLITIVNRFALITKQY